MPIKVGLGGLITQFYNELVPDTPALVEFTGRGASKSIAWCPERMIDEAEKILARWRRFSIDSTQTNPSSLPLIAIAISKDYTPTPREYSTQVYDPVYFSMTQDAKSRAFKARIVATDIRCQLVVFANDTNTAKSIATQFCLFIESPKNRKFNATFNFSGIDDAYPVKIESSDLPASVISTEAKNLSILAIDLTLHATIPLYTAPVNGLPNDGKGTNFTNDKSGFPVVTNITERFNDTL